MKTFKLIPALIVGLLLFVSAPIASAQDNTISKPFCQNVEVIGGNMISSMEAKRQNNSSVNFDSQVQTATQKLNKVRIEADQFRNRHFELIIVRVKDPNQKTAVQHYRDAITVAINTRRNSVDAAQSEFVGKLTELINEHQQAVAKDEEEFIGNVKQSIEDAKGNCADASQTQTARTQFATKLKLIKADFALKKQALSKHSLEYRQLVVNRNIAVARAISDYQQSERQAKQQFLSEVNLGR